MSPRVTSCHLSLCISSRADDISWYYKKFFWLLWYLFLFLHYHRRFRYSHVCHHHQDHVRIVASHTHFSSLFQTSNVSWSNFSNCLSSSSSIVHGLDVNNESVMVCLVCMPPNHLQSSPTPSAYTPVSLWCTLRKLTQPCHSCGWTKLGSMSNFPRLSPYVSGHRLFVFFSICHICLMHFHWW